MTVRNSRPRRVAATGEPLKLHRRVLMLDGRVYTVVTLRPGTDFRFSTNRFHETWHVLSDWRGARVLARLLWGLSYQRRPGTLVLLDPAHLDPNPFDAAPADPIVLVPSDRTVFTRKAAAELRRKLPLRGRSAGTVRWQTFGLAAESDKLREWRERMSAGTYEHMPAPRGHGRVDRVGRLLVFAGSAQWLRSWAVSVAWLGEDAPGGSDYVFLDEAGAGEVQIFRQYRRMVGAARRARAEVCAVSTDPEDTVESRIQERACVIRRRGLPAVPIREQPLTAPRVAGTEC
ncbi:hypothetical protein [Nocardia sp. X0981]